MARNSSNTTQVSAATSNKLPFKKFTTVELQEHQWQVLCYYYDEKYNPSHIYHSQCLILLDKDDLEDILTSSPPEQLQEESVEKVPEVSFNAFSGEYHPSTLRLKVLLKIGWEMCWWIVVILTTLLNHTLQRVWIY